MTAKFRTLNEVKYNKGLLTGTSSGIVTMTIHGANRVWKGNQHTVEVDYDYSDAESVLKRAGMILEKGEVNALYEAIQLPMGLTNCEVFELQVKIGAKMKFAETFGILVDEIEEVIEE